PVVGLRQLCAQALEVAVDLGDVRTHGPFGMARPRLAPIEIALVARVGRDGLEHGLVVGHVGPRAMGSEGLAPTQRSLRPACKMAGCGAPSPAGQARGFRAHRLLGEALAEGAVALYGERLFSGFAGTAGTAGSTARRPKKLRPRVRARRGRPHVAAAKAPP